MSNVPEPDPKIQALKVRERLAAELEAILKSSKINREKLAKLWVKIEDLDAAIQANQRIRAVSQRKRRPENRASG